ncbi:hypothetical protein CHLRE_12g534930v5 [Chlamydomonas reinhardtii]|uniref:Uncharacterized protein n=1 Tax=Chlamydomonas reinhardtii TaxID=3055 RepID=A0A2K3D529_CHLRE|nr:uncharacterized protein CHLRE_12g534930v5 [Chlamydomonas reinhardtii]PNW75638.1 hypothetical protein CHLRE_12g534930v5 [Chlamydomonas reinhardtii]
MAENHGRSSEARWSPGFGPIAMGVDLPSALSQPGATTRAHNSVDLKRVAVHRLLAGFSPVAAPSSPAQDSQR